MADQATHLSESLTLLLSMSWLHSSENIVMTSPSPIRTGSPSPHPPRRYRGHRANSFLPIDVNELVEIRARQRTFNGAYSRTALGNLCYSLAVLRLFDRRFYRIGILYAVLAGLLFIASFFRARHSRHDFADHSKDDIFNRPPALQTKGQHGKRIFGRPFVTAGWIVVAVSALVAAVEFCLLVLIFYL